MSSVEIIDAKLTKIGGALEFVVQVLSNKTSATDVLFLGDCQQAMKLQPTFTLAAQFMKFSIDDFVRPTSRRLENFSSVFDASHV
jgi:hypothetical protein